jgi:cytochrome c-type biogenesis protein CcsB
MKNKVLAIGILIQAWALVVSATHTFALEVKDLGQPRSQLNLKALGDIPVQAGGRIKPFNTYAREMATYLTGSKSFQGWQAEDLLLSWLISPEAWEGQNFIQVQREDVKRQIGLDPKQGRFSPKTLISESHLGQYAQALSGRGENALAKPPLAGGAPKEDPREKELKTVLDRLGTWRAVVTGEAWPMVPPGAEPLPGREGWATLADRDYAPGAPVHEAFAQLISAYAEVNPASFESAVGELRSAIEGRIPDWTEADRKRVDVESLYNRARPFMWAWISYLVAALLGALSHAWEKSAAQEVVGRGRRLFQGALALGAVGTLMHILGMGMRIWIAGRPPVSNMYESVIWVSFGTMLFAWVLYINRRAKILITVSSAVAAFLLIVADSAPTVMDPSIHPLVPVLRSNLWLTVHVLTITLGYAAFALTLGLGNVTLYHFARRGEGSSSKIAALNDLTYRAMQFGVVLLAAGTLLGGVWADYSWGRFWGWDPKEVWALIALMGYIIVLHARYTGWVGQFGFAALTVLGFTLVVMAWYGVNFVLGAGLHSYGFSTGGRGAVAALTLLQFAYVGGASWMRARMRSASKPGSESLTQTSQVSGT